MKEKIYTIKTSSGEFARVTRDRRRCKGCRRNFTFNEMLSRDIKDYCYCCKSNRVMLEGNKIIKLSKIRKKTSEDSSKSI